MLLTGTRSGKCNNQPFLPLFTVANTTGGPPELLLGLPQAPGHIGQMDQL